MFDNFDTTVTCEEYYEGGFDFRTYNEEDWEPFE